MTQEHAKMKSCSSASSAILASLWAVVSAVAAFLTLGTHVLLFCSVFSDIVLFCVSKINWWWRRWCKKCCTTSTICSCLVRCWPRHHQRTNGRTHTTCCTTCCVCSSVHPCSGVWHLRLLLGLATLQHSKMHALQRDGRTDGRTHDNGHCAGFIDVARRVSLA